MRKLVGGKARPSIRSQGFLNSPKLLRGSFSNRNSSILNRMILDEPRLWVLLLPMKIRALNQPENHFRRKNRKKNRTRNLRFSTNLRSIRRNHRLADQPHDRHLCNQHGRWIPKRRRARAERVIDEVFFYSSMVYYQIYQMIGG